MEKLDAELANLDSSEDDGDYVPGQVSDEEDPHVPKSKRQKPNPTKKQAGPFGLVDSEDEDGEYDFAFNSTKKTSSNTDPAHPPATSSPSPSPPTTLTPITSATATEKEKTSSGDAWQSLMAGKSGGKVTGPSKMSANSLLKSLNRAKPASTAKTSAPRKGFNIDAMFGGIGRVRESGGRAEEKTSQSATAKQSTAQPQTTGDVSGGAEAKVGGLVSKGVRGGGGGGNQTGLQKILAEMAGGKKVSTVGQSRNDWKNFREKVLEDEEVHELDSNRKNGVVDKAEFLARSQMRQEDLSREMRRSMNPRARK